MAAAELARGKRVKGVVMFDQVFPADRFRLHGRRADVSRSSVEFRVLDACTYWESFPRSYTPEQVAAARELHIASRAGFDSPEWTAAFRVAAAAVARSVVDAAYRRSVAAVKRAELDSAIAAGI